MADWEDDERLAARYAADGDARALETLFRRHLDATYAFARRFLPSREDAEEAASETWLRAGRALRAGGFRGESRFKTWLLGIARLVCLERLRQPRLPTLSLSGLTETAPGRLGAVLARPGPGFGLDDALAVALRRPPAWFDPLRLAGPDRCRSRRDLGPNRRRRQSLCTDAPAAPCGTRCEQNRSLE